MTGFLHHLAGLALGATPAGAARPVLPSRFASPPSGFEIMRDGADLPAETPPQPMPAGPAPVDTFQVPVAPDRASTRIETAVVLEETSRGMPPARAASPLAAEVPASRTWPGPGVAIQPSVPRPLAGTTDDARSDRPVRPVVAAAAKPVPEVDGPPLPMAAPDRGRLDDPILRPVTRSAPLSDLAVAGRTVTAHDERPVIHVTIDRIDVRAPMTAKPAAERRSPRPQPTVSLADYLREGTGGGRR